MYLSNEIWYIIFSKLCTEDVVSASRVCRVFFNVALSVLCDTRMYKCHANALMKFYKLLGSVKHVSYAHIPRHFIVLPRKLISLSLEYCGEIVCVEAHLATIEHLSVEYSPIQKIDLSAMPKIKTITFYTRQLSLEGIFTTFSSSTLESLHIAAPYVRYPSNFHELFPKLKTLNLFSASFDEEKKLTLPVCIEKVEIFCANNIVWNENKFYPKLNHIDIHSFGCVRRLARDIQATSAQSILITNSNVAKFAVTSRKSMSLD